MFARNASLRLKSLAVSSEYTETMKSEVIPLLRQQNGFIGELTLANPHSMETVSISVWESREDAEHYEANVYPEVVKILAQYLAARPVVHNFETVATNFHREVT
jgi:heme-degrading monooxygenase HmoA